jgi:HAD superfamily hydrolase (TIGR01490 family)
MRIALFDLDHTLIPFDSGAAFTRHLIAVGALDAGFMPRYEAFCRRYAAGDVDMHEMHGLMVGEASVHAPAALAGWVREAADAMAPRVSPAARALVESHRAQGHACALVTATTRFIAEGFARLLGLDDVLATEPERDAQGRYTGRIEGEPCFREYKIAHVEAWLARRGAAWDDVERSWFYSDSAHDLPLLARVTDPTAVDPDPALRREAEARGWPILSLLARA